MKKQYIFILLLTPFLSIAQPTLEWSSEYATAKKSLFSNNDLEAKFDSSENVISGIQNGNDWKILKHDSNGNLLWEFFYEHTNKIAERMNDFLIDANDDIIIAGATTTQTFTDYDIFDSESKLIVLKISAAGNLLWTYTKSGAEWTDNYASSIDIDENNNLFIAGRYYTSQMIGMPGGPILPAANIGNLITIKLDGQGNQIWENTIAEVNPKSIQYINNTITVVGKSGFSSNTNLDFFKYDLSGNLISQNRISDSYSSYSKFDKVGNFYTYSYSGVFKMSKFDANGSLVWAFEEPTNLPTNIIADELIAIDIDDNYNVFVTGRHYGENYNDQDNYTNADILTIKLNEMGQELWRNRYENEGNNTAEIGNHIEILENGNAIVTGYIYTNFENGYLNKVVYMLDVNGNPNWLIDNDNTKDEVGVSSHIFNNALYVVSYEENNDNEVIYNTKKYKQTTDCVADLNINTLPNSGVYRASNTINSNITISNNATIAFYAGNSICLNNGFNVAKNANFTADNSGCQN